MIEKSNEESLGPRLMSDAELVRIAQARVRQAMDSVPASAKQLYLDNGDDISLIHHLAFRLECALAELKTLAAELKTLADLIK